MITSLIEEQKARGVQTGDHFAKPGSNDRLWSALEKLAVTDPETFVDYFANDVVNLVSVAWLGPNYQIVSDPNVVNPGGTAQTAHRDYHLGFMDLDLAAQFPAHVHRLSPVLTLQGAVAHVDMPVETGPTMYLPHSQKLRAGVHGDRPAGVPGVLRGSTTCSCPWRRATRCSSTRPCCTARAPTGPPTSSAWRTCCRSRRRSAGRWAPSTPSGSPEAVYATLRARKAAGASEKDLHNVVAAAAEGYPFPTNLDRDKPVGSLKPESQAQLVWRALQNDWDERDVRGRAGRADRASSLVRSPR